MQTQSEKYGELLQEIARIIAKKNIQIERLHGEINRLNLVLDKTERTKKHGK